MFTCAYLGKVNYLRSTLDFWVIEVIAFAESQALEMPSCLLTTFKGFI